MQVDRGRARPSRGIRRMARPAGASAYKRVVAQCRSAWVQKPWFRRLIKVTGAVAVVLLFVAMQLVNVLHLTPIISFSSGSFVISSESFIVKDSELGELEQASLIEALSHSSQRAGQTGHALIVAVWSDAAMSPSSQNLTDRKGSAPAVTLSFDQLCEQLKETNRILNEKLAGRRSTEKQNGESEESDHVQEHESMHEVDFLLYYDPGQMTRAQLKKLTSKLAQSWTVGTFTLTELKRPGKKSLTEFFELIKGATRSHAHFLLVFADADTDFPAIAGKLDKLMLDMVRYHAETSNNQRFEDFDPHLPHLPGEYLTRRRRNEEYCIQRAGLDPLYADDKWVAGLPNRTLLSKNNTSHQDSLEKNAQFLDWDGTVQDTASEFYKMHASELDALIQMAREHDDSISLTVINEAFLPFAYSFMCNVKVADYWPPGPILFVTNDARARDMLHDIPRTRVLFFPNLSGAEGRGNEYKMAGYWSFMLSRTQLVNELLKRDIQVFLFDLDQVWLRDPWLYMSQRIPAGGWDMLVTRGYSKSGSGELQGNFLVLRPNMRTRALWDEITHRFQISYNNCCANVEPDTFVGGIEQDQNLLSHLMAFSAARFIFALKLIQLDRDLFVDGMWYTPGKYTSVVSKQPISIQNNWIVGVQNKIERAQKYGHWFWTGTGRLCDFSRVLETCSVRAEVKARHQPYAVIGLVDSDNVTKEAYIPPKKVAAVVPSQKPAVAPAKAVPSARAPSKSASPPKKDASKSSSSSSSKKATSKVPQKKK
ncbi:hypothetical protein FVE85_0309 [Porphyridium purpureum]|uniref:Nucleotide-diphospho-sugar transferase domain-containing protein n=1 Tax=Porphyridium purpureum TaxID=35688 RepID=A0A5J4YZY7_PORPP|nr:hypothetical protein FVE85_0309 [Porphyridium purpureum]|eukprot:POR8315..scf208_2